MEQLRGALALCVPARGTGRGLAVQIGARLPQSPQLLPARESGFPLAEGFHLGWTNELDPGILQGEKLLPFSTIHT